MPLFCAVCLFYASLFSAFAIASPALVAHSQDAQSVLTEDGLEGLRSWASEDVTVRELPLTPRPGYRTSHVSYSQPNCICEGAAIPQAWQEDIQDPLLCDDDLLDTVWDISTPSNTTYHNLYHPLNEIEDFMLDLATVHPDIVQLQYIGHSAQSREMIAMKLSKPSVNATNEDGYIASAKKAGFVIAGAQHSREVCVVFSLSPRTT